MFDTKIRRPILSSSVAREIAEREGPQADILVFLIEQALKEARDEALRRGVVIDVEQAPTFGSWKE